MAKEDDKPKESTQSASPLASVNIPKPVKTILTHSDNSSKTTRDGGKEDDK